MISRKKFLGFYIPIFSSVVLVNKKTNAIENLFKSWSNAAKHIYQITNGDDKEIAKLNDKYTLEETTGIFRLYLIITKGFTIPLPEFKIYNNEK